jgi:hypothetical protein
MFGVEITGFHIPRLQALPVAVMGAMRSGTNYLTYLLEQNYRCRVREDIYGWKHSIIPPRTVYHGRRLNLAPVVSVAKHPQMFLKSLYRYHLQVKRNMIASPDWIEFVTGRFVVYYARTDRSPQLHFANPVDYWNWLYGNLTTLPAQKFRSAHVAYETLSARPETECERLAELLGLKRKTAAFVLPRERLGRASSATRGHATYVNEKDRKVSEINVETEFTPALADFVRRQADPALMERFGYGPDPGA